MTTKRSLEEIADDCLKSIYYDEDTGQVRADPEFLRYASMELVGALREAADAARQEERIGQLNVADPLVRVIDMNVSLDIPDTTPLRDVLPGVWPVWRDLRQLVISLRDPIYSSPNGDEPKP